MVVRFEKGRYEVLIIDSFQGGLEKEVSSYHGSFFHDGPFGPLVDDAGTTVDDHLLLEENIPLYGKRFTAYQAGNATGKPGIEHIDVLIIFRVQSDLYPPQSPARIFNKSLATRQHKAI